MKLIEAWGSGIQKMKTELQDYPEIELVLQEAGHAFQVQFVKKERNGAESGQSGGRVGAESQPESQRTILGDRVLRILNAGSLSKAEISQKLHQKEVSGQLNTVIRKLREDGLIEYTIPEKPNSRLQKYRLIDKNKKDVQTQ
jgi:ATP-dependent DNA helicase RecG